MYVVIAGGGKVGRSIAVDLLQEGHDVTVIEQEEGRCEALLRDHDVLVILGDATDVRYLEQAKPDRADIFVATTHDDDVNFVACQLALTTFGVPRVIARVNAPRNEQLFEKMRIEAVSTTSLISRLIRDQATVGDLIHLRTLRAGKIDLVEIDVPADHPLSEATVAELGLPSESVLVCIFRGNETVLPRGDTRLHPGDQVIALSKPDSEQALRDAVLRQPGPGHRRRGASSVRGWRSGKERS